MRVCGQVCIVGRAISPGPLHAVAVGYGPGIPANWAALGPYASITFRPYAGIAHRWTGHAGIATLRLAAGTAQCLARIAGITRSTRAGVTLRRTCNAGIALRARAGLASSAGIACSTRAGIALRARAGIDTGSAVGAARVPTGAETGVTASGLAGETCVFVSRGAGACRLAGAPKRAGVVAKRSCPSAPAEANVQVEIVARQRLCLHLAGRRAGVVQVCALLDAYPGAA